MSKNERNELGFIMAYLAGRMDEAETIIADPKQTDEHKDEARLFIQVMAKELEALTSYHLELSREELGL